MCLCVNNVEWHLMCLYINGMEWHLMWCLIVCLLCEMTSDVIYDCVHFMNDISYLMWHLNVFSQYGIAYDVTFDVGSQWRQATVHQLAWLERQRDSGGCAPHPRTADWGPLCCRHQAFQRQVWWQGWQPRWHQLEGISPGKRGSRSTPTGAVLGSWNWKMVLAGFSMSYQ